MRETISNVCQSWNVSILRMKSAYEKSRGGVQKKEKENAMLSDY